MKLPEPTGPLWCNGRWTTADRVAVRFTDPGLLAGIGVFETIGVEEGECLELDEHLARLEAGAQRLDVPLGDLSAVRDAARTEAARPRQRRGWVKVVATRGGDRVLFGGSIDGPADRPARAVLLRWRRDPLDPLAGLKTLNYAFSVLGLEEARRRGADEGLWRNTRGHLAEGCTSNLFLVRHRTVYTPAERDGILPGITRGVAMAAARRLGLQVHRGKIRTPRLTVADEAFLTSSVGGIRPLVAVDARPVGRGRPGPVTRSIIDEVRRWRRCRREESHSWNTGPE